MKITAKTTTTIETTVKVSGVETSWEALESIKKELKKICRHAKVNYLKGGRGAKSEGFKITSPGTAPKLKDEDFVRGIVENAVAEATKKIAKDKAENVQWVETFKFRNVGTLKARGKYQEKIQEIIAALEDSAKHAKETMTPDEAYYCMFDMPAYYEVWDAVRKHGWQKAAEAAQHQDTAVRERFCDYFDMLEDEGKKWE